MSPLILSAASKVFFTNGTPLFSVMISVSHADGSFVTNLSQESFDFGYFPTSDQLGVGLMGLVTQEFQNYSNVLDQDAPGFYGISLKFDDPAEVKPYTPMLFVTVTELGRNWGASGDEPASHIAAQGQIVIYVEEGL